MKEHSKCNIKCTCGNGMISSKLFSLNRKSVLFMRLVWFSVANREECLNALLFVRRLFVVPLQTPDNQWSRRDLRRPFSRLDQSMIAILHRKIFSLRPLYHVPPYFLVLLMAKDVVNHVSYSYDVKESYKWKIPPKNTNKKTF